MNEWIAKLFENPELTRMGHGQRVEDMNLGLGWLYYAMARTLRPTTVVVIGSYRGFVPLILGKAMMDNAEKGELIFIDPSMADDFWKDPRAVAEHFASFGVTNVRHFCMTTQQFVQTEAYRSLGPVGIVFVDGYHSEEQARFDYEAFEGRLAPHGVVMFHDSIRIRASWMYGDDDPYEHRVKCFMDTLKQNKNLQVFDIPFFDGVSFVRKSRDPARGDAGMSAPTDSSKMPLWAITSYFNPQHYRRRLETYRLFRQHLQVPLVTVELSFGDDFDLKANEADILIQLRTTDVLWHKERLLNIALDAVPRHCRHIAWLDCDVVFDRSDWPERTRAMLDQFALVEPFTNAYKIRQDAKPTDIDRAHSDRLGYSLAYGLSIGAVGYDMLDKNMHINGCTDGLAWAARREVFEDMGFYDACIMGSGNRAMVCAALGQFQYALNYLQMNRPREEHFLAWAKPHFEAVQGKIGFVEGDLFHLWHGEYKNRRYPERHQDFKAFDFDPLVDLAVDAQGCWRWNSDKPEMHQYVRDYFASRKEDGE